MSIVSELIRKEDGGKLSFGNHELSEKAKVEDFEKDGNLYKVKTYKDMTKLERDGMFVYESVPGTSVLDFETLDNGVSFKVSAAEDVQLTIGLTEDTEYEVFVAGKSIGRMSTGLGGKLNISIELQDAEEVEVKVLKS